LKTPFSNTSTELPAMAELSVRPASDGMRSSIGESHSALEPWASLALGPDPFGNQAGVTATAEGAVDEGLARLGVEDIDQLCRENGLMFGGHI
jgi:hypothetical protein